MDNKINKIFQYFKLLMAVFYFAIGLYFIINAAAFQAKIQIEYVKILGGILIAYGLFRGYRVFSSDFAKNK